MADRSWMLLKSGQRLELLDPKPSFGFGPQLIAKPSVTIWTCGASH